LTYINGGVGGDLLNKITQERQNDDDVCPGFKERINDIIYGQGEEDGQEVAKDTNAKREKKKNQNKTPS
jgi:hypothetical protein